MKTKELKDLPNKTIEELEKMVSDLRSDIMQLQIDKALGKVKNVNEKRLKQKDIARVLTVISIKTKEEFTDPKIASTQDSKSQKITKPEKKVHRKDKNG